MRRAYDSIFDLVIDGLQIFTQLNQELLTVDLYLLKINQYFDHIFD